MPYILSNYEVWLTLVGNLDLKAAGWEFLNRGGSLRTFQQELNGHKILLNINIGYYLTSDIVELKFSAVAK